MRNFFTQVMLSCVSAVTRVVGSSEAVTVSVAQSTSGDVGPATTMFVPPKDKTSILMQFLGSRTILM